MSDEQKQEKPLDNVYDDDKQEDVIRRRIQGELVRRKHEEIRAAANARQDRWFTELGENHIAYYRWHREKFGYEPNCRVGCQRLHLFPHD